MLPCLLIGGSSGCISEYQQNGPSEVNGHMDGDEKEQQPPRQCDIVHITGKPENCEAAKQMLLETVPITLEVRFLEIRELVPLSQIQGTTFGDAV